ncbi:CopG family transcriptional regulator [Streptococcus pseudopneumoniae G42]|nr:CopG family transcriptional regulator [Streptococcus pseudopneumoniae G42]
MATDKNRIMISLDDKNLDKLENLVEDARDRRGIRLTKSQVIELLLNTVDYFDDIMGAIYSKNNSKNAIIFLQTGATLVK